MRVGAETSGLGAVTGGFETFAFMMGEGVVTPGLFGFPCHRCCRRSPVSFDDLMIVSANERDDDATGVGDWGIGDGACGGESRT